MLTGKDDLVSVDTAFEVGATDFLTKPVNWRILGHRVRYVLRARDTLAALAESAAQLRQSQEIARIGQWTYHWQREIFELSPFAKELIGVTGDDNAPQDLLAHIHPEDRDIILHAWPDSPEHSQPLDAELRFITATSRVRWMRVCAEHQRDRVGMFLRTVGIVQDISERKAKDAEIQTLAYFDSLTGLANRYSFLQRLEIAIGRARYQKSCLGLLFVDLDNFKTINDTLGHDAGDEVLVEVSRRILKIIRSGLLPKAESMGEYELARPGGDEFIMMTPHLENPKAASAVAALVQQELRTPFELRGQTLSITASIGIATYPKDGEDAVGLLKHADSAMYLAKEEGRNTLRYFDASYSKRLARNLHLSNLVRHALQQGEFHVEYQPIIGAHTGGVDNVEALVRWIHPQEGRISPAEFIPIAESVGLIGALGEWVLRRACADIAVMRREPGCEGLRVSVNLSAGQLKQLDINATVSSALDEAHLPAEALTLEITESVLIESNAHAMGILNALSARGVHITLDDFGTGYASMSYLKRLPLDGIKIDRSFVNDLLSDADDQAIVRAIIAVAKALQLTVTAEGVETAEQRTLLQELGCDYLQGFHFSPSARPAQLLPMVQRGWPRTH
jgi:diguanylate cyclase (GGDEF)-like protein/PAS domain S-box-containing protein